MKSFFEELFRYNHHFNHQLSKLFEKKSHMISERPKILFSHILNAHHIWISRITNRQIEYGVWDIQQVEQFTDINTKNFNNTTYILRKFHLNGNITYKNSKGQEFENTIRDILFHIINHSTYHRGQIAYDFRQSGIEPLNTDYILYKRAEQ